MDLDAMLIGRALLTAIEVGKAAAVGSNMVKGGNGEGMGCMVFCIRVAVKAG